LRIETNKSGPRQGPLPSGNLLHSYRVDDKNDVFYVLEIVIFKLAKLNNQRMTANNEPTQMAKLSRDSTKKGD